MTAPPPSSVEAALEHARAGAWRWRPDRRSMWWNPSHEILFGLGPGTFPGTLAAWIDLIVPEDRTRVVETLTAPRHEGSSTTFAVDYRCARPDGSTTWLITRGTLEADPGGEIVGGAGITFEGDPDPPAGDTTGTSPWIVGDPVAFGGLERIATRLTAAETPDQVGEVLVDDIVPVVGAGAACLHIVDQDGDHLEAIVLHGYPEDTTDHHRRVPIEDDSPLAAAFRRGEPTIVTGGAEPWSPPSPDAIEAVCYVPLTAGRRTLGILGLAFDHDPRQEPTTAGRVGIISAMCAQTLTRAIAQTAVRRAHTRLAGIDEITDAALSKLSLEDLLQELPRRVAASIGCDTVRIMLIEDDGQVLREHGRFGIGPGSADVPVGRGLAGKVAATAEPVVFDDISRTEVIGPSLPPHVTAVAGFPLTSGGAVIGVLDVGAGPDRPFTDDDIELLGLAGDRIATAIERSRAYEIERNARRNADLMGRLGDIISAGGPLPPVATQVARLCAETLAERSVLTVFANGGNPVVAAAHTDPALDGLVQSLAESAPFDAAAHHGRGAVVRSGRIESAPPEDPTAIDDPEHRRLVERLGAAWRLTVPLRGTSRIVGTLELARPGTDFAPDEVRVVNEVATRIGVAIESRLSHERHREAAMALQESLLPAGLPAVTGADVATGYWPAADDFDIGGDFFDVIEIAPDRWGLLIGDISGKGIPAAAMTGIARQTARAAARHGLEPDEVLHWVHDAFLSQRETMGNYCSAIYGVVEPCEGGLRFRFAVGGHPPPIVRPAGGEARYTGNTGTVLGLIDPIRTTISEVILGEGDWLVLYTDGMTDVPVADAIDEEELLLLVDKACQASPDAALASLERMLKTRYDVAHRDDTALLILRYTGEPVPGRR